MTKKDILADSENPSNRDLSELIEWLFVEGRLFKEPQQLFAQLATRLSELGLPLLRMRISLRTLDPQVVGRSYIWWRGQSQLITENPPHSIMQSTDYLGSPIEALYQTGKAFRCRLETNSSELHSTLQDLKSLGASDYLLLPIQLTYDDNPTPWIIVTDRIGGFSVADVAALTRLGTFLSPIIEVYSQRLSAEALLNTYLGSRSGRQVLDGQIKRGDGELIEAAIWYCDLRDSTAIAESLNHHQLLQILNLYFEIISNEVEIRGGEVLRFIGDAMLIMFPIDVQRPHADACHAAIDAAQAVHQRIAAANPELTAQGLPVLRYGVGLDVGKVVYGNVGAPNRLDFTVMGTVVNRASRIESLTKKCRCQLLMSEQFSTHISQSTRLEGAFEVAGVTLPINVYSLQDASH